jgi:hypothetical protein
MRPFIIFYGTEGDDFDANFDIGVAQQSVTDLFGANPPVNTFSTLYPAQLIPLTNGKEFLEITVKRILYLNNLSIVCTFLDTNNAIQNEENARIANPLNESIGLNVIKYGNLSQFKFRVSNSKISVITNNYTFGLKVTLGIVENEICLILYAFQPIAQNGNLAFAAARTNPSGGVKIP